MGGLKGRLRQLRVFAHKRLVEQELDEELSIHIEMETEKNIRGGMSPAEARRAALVAFGGVERTKERVRDARWTRWLEDAVADIRYAFRSLAKSPGFTAAAVLTLAIGVGANTAVFGVVEALFLRQPAGIENADRVVRLYIVRDRGMVQTPTGGGGSYPDFLTVRERVPGLSGIAAFGYATNLDLGRGEDARRVRGRTVSQSFFPLLGVRMAAGRAFVQEEGGAGGGLVAVISYRLWQEQFGGDPSVIGRSVLINGRAWLVVGVADKAFTGIEPQAVDVWLPMAAVMSEGERDNPFSGAMHLVGRRADAVAPSVIAEQATAALTDEARTIRELDPTPHVLIGSLLPTSGPHKPKAATLALWLWAVAGTILGIGCANLANLLLARSTRRQREMASRLALGASPGRLVRQILTESTVLSLLGAAAGLLVAYLAASIMRQFPIPPAANELHRRLLGFALLVAVFAATVAALAPAISAARSDPGRWLGSHRSTGSPQRGRLRAGLVTVQVALSAVLLVGAGLFVRSLSQVYAVDPGVDVDRLLVASIDLEKSGYAIPDREVIYSAAQDRLRNLPGVENVSLATFAPLDGGYGGLGVQLEGRDSAEVVAQVNWVGPDYFRTVGTKVLRGRGVEDGDGRDGGPVVVVNQRLARQLTPSGNVLDQCLMIVRALPRGACARIIGVVGDQRSSYLHAGIGPTIYLPRKQNPDAFSLSETHLLVRSRNPGALAGRVRETLQTLRPDLPYVSVESLESRIRPEILPYRLGATLFSVFGLLALSIAALGLYGVIGYFVSERAPEIGIRRSLGAKASEVVSLTVWQSATPVTTGIVTGLAAAYAGGRLIESQLFGVSGRDPTAFGVAAGLLLGVALLASWLPARRAARVDPMTVLRVE